MIVSFGAVGQDPVATRVAPTSSKLPVFKDPLIAAFNIDDKSGIDECFRRGGRYCESTVSIRNLASVDIDYKLTS